MKVRLLTDGGYGLSKAVGKVFNAKPKGRGYYILTIDILKAEVRYYCNDRATLFFEPSEIEIVSEESLPTESQEKLAETLIKASQSAVKEALSVLQYDTSDVDFDVVSEACRELVKSLHKSAGHE